MVSRASWLAFLLIAASAMAGAAAPDLGTVDLGPLQRLETQLDPHADPFEQARHALSLADEHTFGSVPATTPAPAVSLDDALRRVVGAEDGASETEVDAALAAMSALPPLTRAAIAQVLGDFAVVQDETTAAFDADGVPHWSGVAAAQHQLLDAIADLTRAVNAEGLPTAGTMQGPVVIGPVAIDIGGTSDTYEEHFLVVIDLAGDDTYLNNAGGNSASVKMCGSDESLIPRQPTAALLVDLSGADKYQALRDCGVNGGGAYGSGMLVDVAGDDRYETGGRGTNGGGYAYGLGLLVDLAGRDEYIATGAGANGGGYAGGFGRLIEVRGWDRYTATSGGTNGGASGGYHCVNMCQEVVVASGLLLDLGGRDHYDDFVVRGQYDENVYLKEGMGMQLDFAFTM